MAQTTSSFFLPLRLSLREIRADVRMSLLFVIGLAIGLSGLGALDSLKYSIKSALSLRSKGILAADLGVSSRRAMTDKEIESVTRSLPKGAVTANEIESYTMVSTTVSTTVSTGKTSRLVELRVVDDTYPFYGDIQLRKLGTLGPGAAKELFHEPTVWVYPELLLQLGLKVGDTLKIGGGDFKVADEVLYDSAGAGSDVSMAPPIFLASKYLPLTKLMQTGSTAFRTILVKLPTNADAKAIDELALSIEHNLHEPEIHVMTPKDASEQIGRALNYLGDYLGLASLVALFLTALGQVFLFRSYLTRRYRDIAILKSLGMQNRTVAALYFWQIVILSLLAVIPALVITSVALPPLEKPIHDILNVDIQLSLQSTTVALLLFAALWSSIAISGPLCIRTFTVNPRELLQPSDALKPLPWSKWLLLYTPAILSYFAMSVWLAKSLRVGSLFFGLLFASLVVLSAVGAGCLWLMKRISPHGFVKQMTFRHLTRTPFASLTAFLALALGVLLTNLIPQIEKGIQDELSTPRGLEQPSLFLFDIQDEQIEPLKTQLSTMNVAPMMVSPLVRARLKFVNGEAFNGPEHHRDRAESKTREQESENRTRNRGYNLSVRSKLSPSETIVKEFKGAHLPDVGLISLEEKFADRLGINLGDKLTFDVQGVDVDGQVINFRKVRWTSFQPNFFIQFQPGPLDEAPKTYLVTLPPLNETQKLKVQTEIVASFANVTVIDISRLVERLEQLLHQMGFALKIMAGFSLAVGFLVLFSIANQSLFERRKDANLLKTLGASFRLTKNVFIFEFLLITSVAVILGTALSFVISFTLTYQLFDSIFEFGWAMPLIIAVTTLIVSFIIVWSIVTVVLQKPPRDLLALQ